MPVLKIVEKRRLWYSISLFFIVIGFIMMGQRILTRQPVVNWGVDFKGGSTMMLSVEALDQRIKAGEAQGKSENEISTTFINDVRNVLKEEGLEDSTIQVTQDHDLIIKTIEMTPQDNLAVRHRLTETFGPHEVLEIDFIGPSIGAELRQKSIIITILALLMIVGYISWRFEFVYGLAALAALLHDALVTISLTAVFNLEINSVYVAAFLTILGYSMNDTIIIFDRVRELTASHGQSHSVAWITNSSIVQTAMRTVNTVSVTLVMLITLLIFGGSTLNTFCIVLIIGIVAGTYSTICVATPILVSLKTRQEALLDSHK